MENTGQLNFSFLGKDEEIQTPELKKLKWNISLIESRSILSKTGISCFDYVINCYRGCSLGCLHCYASFMKKFTGHKENWGDFVDVKTNAVEVLKKEIKKINKGRVFLSSVTDPYLPLEAKFRLTRGVLECLIDTDFEVTILTRSPLVTRDIGIFKKLRSVEVGLSVPTDREDVRKIFEPNATPISSRIKALRKLKEEGIKTYAFIAPLLPLNPDNLALLLDPVADYVMLDNLNYPWKVSNIIREHGFEYILDSEWVDKVANEFQRLLGRKFSR
ncbi:MAG TPA: radical SAM protein [Thermodesulfobacteriota bacterium]|nr:radical SAM protein [Thermodesulfobacteriota bacterium]